MPTETTSSNMPPWLEAQMIAYLDRARTVADQPYQAYQGVRTAPIAPEQNAAMDMVAQRALNGSPIINQGQQALSNTLSGQYLNRSMPQVQAAQNAYLGQVTPQQQNAFLGLTAPRGSNQYLGNTTPTRNNAYGGQQTQVGSNQYMGATTPGSMLSSNPYLGSTANVGRNQYAGSNPYLEDAIRRSKSNSIEDYKTITAAQNDAAFSRAGGLGSSAYNEWTSRNAARQAEQLGNIETGMRMQDYGSQQQLAESDINRRLGAYQTDISRNAGLAGQDQATRLGAYQSDISRNAGLSQQDIQNRIGAQQTDLARNAGIDAQNINNQIGVSQADLARNSGLAEAGLNRDVSTYQTDIARNAGLNQADMARNASLYQGDLSRNAGLYGDYLNQNFQAQQFNTTQGSNSYEAERQRMMQGIQQAPQYGGLAYTDAAALGQVGQQRLALGQQQLDSAYQQFQQQQQYPWQQVQNYGTALGVGSSGQAQASNNQAAANQSNPWASALGGAVAGNQVGGQFGYGGWGALAGGLLGYYGSR